MKAKCRGEIIEVHEDEVFEQNGKTYILDGDPWLDHHVLYIEIEMLENED